MTASVRSRAERKRDTLRELETEVDVWVASAGAGGRANLVPLSFVWDGTALTLALRAWSLTARNLTRAGWGRMALGHTRDVVIVDGPLEVLPIGADPALETPTRARRVQRARRGRDVRLHPPHARPDPGLAR